MLMIGIGVLLLLPQVGQHMEHRHVGFEADYEKVVVVESNGVREESRELFRLYRDARGRMRMEGSRTAEGVTLRFAFIGDPQKGRGVVLDLATGKPLNLRPWSPPEGAGGVAGRPAVGGAPEAGAQTREDLGEAQIEGLAARGWRTTTPSFVSEVWQALAIDQPPLLVKRKEPTRETTERLFNIRIGEPDPQLFAPLDAPQE